MATYYSGKLGSATVGGTAYPLDNWELNSATQAVEVSNFTIPYYQEAYVPNLIGGEIRCSGPLTSVGTPSDVTSVLNGGRPVAGAYATFVLGVAPGLAFSVVGLITEINTSQDVKGRANLEIVAQITPNPNT